MPIISRFFGIVISVFFNDHAPPHIHVRYGKGHEGAEHATIDIRTGILLEGYLPNKVLKLAQKWLTLHQEEVMKAWDQARAGTEPSKIAPLVETSKKTGRDLGGISRRNKLSGVYGSKPYPALRLVEWLNSNLVRLFFSTGLIKEIRLPTKNARRAQIVSGGLGLDIDGKGLEMSAPRLAGMRGRTICKADPLDSWGT